MSTNQSSKRPEIITIRVKDTELKWRLKSAAAEHKTTVSALIEQFLNDGLNNLGGKNDDQGWTFLWMCFNNFWWLEVQSKKDWKKSKVFFKLNWSFVTFVI